MRRHKLVWLGLLLINSAIAQQPQWQVLPTTCIVQKQGDECRMSITVQAINLPTGNYCLRWQKQPLQCWKNISELNITPTVHYRQAQTLWLIDADQHVLFHTRLTIKALQGFPQRRRIRSPWSIF